MISRKRWMIIGVLSAVVLAELVFLTLSKLGKIDLFGLNQQKKQQVTANYIGMNGLPNTRAGEELGVQWARIYLSWSEIEKNNWTEFEKRVNALQGIQLVATVLADNQKEIICPKNIPNVSCPVAEISQYEKFIKAASEKFQGKIRFWQIEDTVFSSESQWQGSIEQYQKILEIAYRTLKSQSKENQIILGGIDLGNLDITKSSSEKTVLDDKLKKVFQLSNNYFDIVDLHLFSIVESIPYRVKWLEAGMANNQFQKPIWSLKISGPDPRAGDFNEQNQASEVVKRMLIGFESGVEKLFYFHYQSSSQVENFLSATLGLKDSSGQQKTSYKAFSVMTEKIGQFTQIKNLELKNNATGYQLSFANKDPIFVIWARGEMSVKLPPEIKGNTKAITAMGENISFDGENIVVSPIPVYVEIQGFLSTLIFCAITII